jgi:hypothetical protein
LPGILLKFSSYHARKTKDEKEKTTVNAGFYVCGIFDKARAMIAATKRLERKTTILQFLGYNLVKSIAGNAGLISENQYLTYPDSGMPMSD